MSALPPSTDDRDIWDIWLAQFRLPVVSVADEVGTLVALSARSMTTAELAQQLQVDARALQIHLGVLAGVNLVERRELRWRATDVARRWLHPESGAYCGPVIARFRQSEPLNAQLMATLRTGGRPEGRQSALDEWERGDMPADMARWLTEYMNAHSRAAALAVAQQPEFADVRSLMDVGGGSAIFPIEIARAHPQFRGTVMEIAPVCHEADRYIAAAGLTSRVRTQAVNMFKEPWPTGHDALFFSNIYHDWSDKTCQMLSDKAFAALPSGGRIFLHEMLMNDDGTGPLPVAAFAVLMLLGTKGRQYSLPELRTFLEQAGFRDVEARRTGGGYYSLVSARKP